MDEKFLKQNDLKRELKEKLRKIFYFQQKYRDKYSFIHINKCGGTSVEKFLNIMKVHDTAEQRIAQIGIKRWEERFTFAIVRHPYSKVVSQYTYKLKTDKGYFKTHPLPLNEWIKISYGDKKREYFNNPPMFMPMLNWVSINDEVVVKKVIKLEEIDAEWESICDNLEIQYAPLKPKNQTARTAYGTADKVLSSESKEIINEHFKCDFAAFGYNTQ